MHARGRPLPTGTLPTTKIPPKGIEAFRKQSIFIAPESQNDDNLKITCKIHGHTYKAVVNYTTSDEDMKYLAGICNRIETYVASIQLYRNGHHIINMSFGSECESADINKVIIWQRDTGQYSLTACEQTPSWNSGEPTINYCGTSLNRPNTNEPVSDEERKELFPKDEYQLKAISSNTAVKTQ